MGSALERLRSSNRFDMKLENGIKLTYRLPQMAEFVLAGLVPMDVVEEVGKKLNEGSTPAEVADVVELRMQDKLLDMKKNREIQMKLIAMMVVALDDENVEGEFSDRDTLDIPDANFAELLEIGMRLKPPGGAEGEA